MINIEKKGRIVIALDHRGRRFGSEQSFRTVSERVRDDRRSTAAV